MKKQHNEILAAVQPSIDKLANTQKWFIALEMGLTAILLYGAFYLTF